MEPTRVTIDQVREWMAQGKAPVFIDSRSPHAWEESGVKIPGAMRLPVDAVDSRLNAHSLPTGKTIVTYCT